jgi:phosphatidylglycerophosphate synthase
LDPQKSIGAAFISWTCLNGPPDGWVAWKYNQQTAFGAFYMDPVADKVSYELGGIKE